MAILLKGKDVSARIKDELKKEVTALKEKGIHPGLAVILVGEDPASQVYVRNKKLACEYIGINSFEYFDRYSIINYFRGKMEGLKKIENGISTLFHKPASLF